LLARRLRGYADAQARQIFRDLLWTCQLRSKLPLRKFALSFIVELICRSSSTPNSVNITLLSPGGTVAVYF